MNTQRWAYETVTLKPGLWSGTTNAEQLKQTLNDMGQKGWELVATPQQRTTWAEVQLIFKRPI